MTSGAVQSVESQVATLRQWMRSAASRNYRETDKRRYAVLTHDGTGATVDLQQAVEIVQESEGAYVLTERWLTPDEFEALPEFQGW